MLPDHSNAQTSHHVTLEFTVCSETLPNQNLPNKKMYDCRVCLKFTRKLIYTVE